MELLCLEKDVIWLMECGDANQYGSFEEFKRKMCQTQIRKTEKGIAYTNPSGEHLEFGWDLPCTIDNRLLKEKEFPLFDNNAAFGEYGEGIILYRNSDMSLNFRY